MAFEQFGSLLAEICSRTPLASGRPLAWTIIANPRAGGFTIRSKWKENYAMLEEHTRRAGKNPLREGGLSGGAGLVFTKAAGHAGEIARALIGEAAVTAEGAPDGGQPFNLIITAGGDGTSREVMTALYYAPAEIRRDFVILRLPMGTGNDGADALSLDKALDLLIELTEIQYQRAIQLVTAGGRGPFLAFNILSVGLDAFVTHMTNKMKGRLPGDSYKLWVDIAALFYDRIYKVGFMDVLATDEGGNEVKAFREKVLLLAVGESGRRTYGSQKRILPDGRNVCAVMQMPLFRKFSLKNDFSRGTHAGTPEATLWNAARVEFRPQYPLLAQMDGETVLLGEKDFPAAIELSCPVIPVLKTKRENGSLLCFISREI